MKLEPAVPQIPVYSAASSDADPYGLSSPWRDARNGELTRIARGLYVATDQWKSLRPWERHAVLAHAVGSRGGGEIVLTHESAALILGLSILGPLPAKAQVVVERGSGGPHGGEVDTRTTTSWAEPIRVGNVWVTPPARTVVDLAATQSFESALIAADSALRQGLVTPEELAVEVERAAGRPGIRRIRAVIERADGNSGAASESLSRARMYQLGARIPILQKRFTIGGVTYYVDFYWEDEDAIGECDGALKYKRADGSANPEAFLAEKRREDSLRGQVRAFKRWGWDDAYHVSGLERVLRDVGALVGPAQALFGLRRR